MVVIPSFQGIDDNSTTTTSIATTPLLISTLPAHHLLLKCAVLGTSTDTSVSMGQSCYIWVGQPARMETICKLISTPYLG